MGAVVAGLRQPWSWPCALATYSVAEARHFVDESVGIDARLRSGAVRAVIKKELGFRLRRQVRDVGRKGNNDNTTGSSLYHIEMHCNVKRWPQRTELHSIPIIAP